MPVRHYSDLIAWQKAVDLAVEVYRQTECFPRPETYGLTNQLRRAAVSIPSNIAEGQGRQTTKDFKHFLFIARGSLQEMETQIIISCRLGFLGDEKKTALMDAATELSRILNGLINSLAD